jgi:predicted regulator of Ras-like GTPase activity (Roadblock/LC7/MglB family)
VNDNKIETSGKSDVLLEKEKFYLEEDISPEVRSVLDDVFAEMVSDDVDATNVDTVLEEAVEIQSKESIHSSAKDLLLEKEKFYAEEDLSPEVKEVIDEVFASMVSDDNLRTASEDNNKQNVEKIPKEIPTVVKKELENEEKDKTIAELSTTVNEYSGRINELEEKIEFYKDLVDDFEEKSNLMETSRKQFEERLNELDESRAEFEERGSKLEHARESFKQLSKNLEEKKIELEQREKNLNQLKRELDRIKQQIESDAKNLDNRDLTYKKQKDKLSILPGGIADKSEINLGLEDDWSDSKLIQMERGKIDILQDILQELLFQGDFQSCFLIDGQGMIISEYSKTELDALAIGAMFSLVCTTVLRTVRSLSLSELEYFKLSSINGEFILRNIDINNYERNFILLAYYNESNSNIPIKKQNLSKKTIKNILKSVKKDFYESRKDSRISWIFDNLSDKIDFLKQKYSHFEGDINLIRLNLMNKASLKLRELFEM